jgi:hypothetical protein
MRLVMNNLKDCLFCKTLNLLIPCNMNNLQKAMIDCIVIWAKKDELEIHLV